MVKGEPQVLFPHFLLRKKKSPYLKKKEDGLAAAGSMGAWSAGGVRAVGAVVGGVVGGGGDRRGERVPDAERDGLGL